MSTTSQPESAARGIADLNPVRFISEQLPGQIRQLQAKLRDNLRERDRMTTELQTLLQHAVLQGVDLCPAPPRVELAVERNADRSTKGSNAEPPPGLAGTDGGDIRGGAR